MLSHEESGRPPGYYSDKAALEHAGKKQVLKVCSLARAERAASSIHVRRSFDFYKLISR
jgi:hypothetical protein